MRWLRVLLWIILVLAVLWVVGRWVFPVPSTAGRPTETAIPFDPNTKLGPRAVDAQAAHPGKSGVLPWRRALMRCTAGLRWRGTPNARWM